MSNDKIPPLKGLTSKDRELWDKTYKQQFLNLNFSEEQIDKKYIRYEFERKFGKDASEKIKSTKQRIEYYNKYNNQAEFPENKTNKNTDVDNPVVDSIKTADNKQVLDSLFKNNENLFDYKVQNDYLNTSDNSRVDTKSSQIAALHHEIDNRYNDENGDVKRVEDINNVKKLAPYLSPYYKEMLNGNNKYLDSEKIEWEKIAPEVSYWLDNNNESVASQVFSKYLKSLMAQEQSGVSKALNWTGRFVGNVGLMGLDLAGMITAAPEAIFKNIIYDGLVGDGIDWSQVGATLLFDNFLSRTSLKAQEELRELLPIYTESNNLLYDPESVAFMASMVVPNVGLAGIASKAAKGTGKAAKYANKFFGREKAIQQATEELKNIKETHPLYERINDIGQRAELDALKEGKSLSEARKLAEEAKIEDLTNMYQRGTIQKRQIDLSSLIESQWEALSAKESIQQRYDNARDEQIRDLTTQMMLGEVSIDIPYSQEKFEKYLQEMIDNNYQEEIYQHFLQNPQSADYPEQLLRQLAGDYMLKEAQVKAQVDAYFDSKDPEFEKRKNMEANLGGTVNEILNFITLKVSESMGGWTTKVPGYATLNSVAAEQKSLGNYLQKLTNQIKSFNSHISNISSRIGFDEVGKAFNKVTPKSTLQKIGSIGGVSVIETGQEIFQELYSSGVEGTGAHNAEQFVLSHMGGIGKEVVDENYENIFTSWIKNAGYGRSSDDWMNLIKATLFQTSIGSPSISKYKYNNDNTAKGKYETNKEYALRQFEKYIPLNSPILQSLVQQGKYDTEAKTFVNIYNDLLDDSKKYSKYSASSMNYAARAFNALQDDSEQGYEYSKFAAQAAESIFLSQLQGKNKDIKLAYYSNLADINTKRDNETQEEFENRRSNTLNELRQDSDYNSIKNASDEELISWAESNGKNMLKMIDDMSQKANQLYEMFDGNIAWETLYGTLYSNALKTYSQEQLNNNENIIKEVSNNIQDTEITENDKGLLSESQLLALNPKERQQVIKNAKGKQLDIVNNLINQLNTNAFEANKTIDVKQLFEKSANLNQVIQDATKDINNIINNPEEFLKSVQEKEVQSLMYSAYNNIIEIVNNDNLRKADKILKINALLDQLSNQAYMYYQGKRKYTGIESQISEIPKHILINALKNTLLSNKFDIIDTATELKAINGVALEQSIGALIKNATEEEKLQYRKLRDDIQASTFAFTDDSIRDLLDSDQIKLLDKILAKHKELIEAKADVDIEEEVPVETDETEDIPSEEEYNEDEKQYMEKHKSFVRQVTHEETSKYTVKSKNKINQIIDELLQNDYNSRKEVVDAIDKKALQIGKDEIYSPAERSLIKNILLNISNRLSDDIKNNTITNTDKKYILASPDLFLNQHPTGNYAEFYKKYNIIDLLQSGKIKEGAEIYAMWSDDFIARSKELYGSNFTKANIGLIAVVKGTIEGYPSITADDGTEYTPIGLFRAYGKGEHSTRNVVKKLISDATDEVFVPSSQDIPKLGTKIINSKPYIIKHLHESKLYPTFGITKDASELSEERQIFEEKQAGSYSEEDTKGIKDRARDWFLSRLRIFEKENGGKLLQISIPRHNDKGVSIPRHNDKGESFITVLKRRISDTLWNGESIIDVLKDEDRRSELISSLSGVPVFVRYKNALQNIFSTNKIKKAVKTFLNEVEKLNTKYSDKDSDKYKKGYKKAISELNESFSAVLNDKWRESLYDILSLPTNIKYYINFNGDLENPKFILGTGLNISSTDDFLELEPNNELGLVKTLSDKTVADALYNLIIDKYGDVKKSPNSANDDFVKWQDNYDYVKSQNTNDRARKVLEDLYDMGVFVMETKTLISKQLEIEFELDSKNEEEITHEQEEKKDDVPENREDTRTLDERILDNVKLLNLGLVADTLTSLDTIAESFSYIAENIELDGTKIRFVGLTDLNTMTVIISDESYNTEGVKDSILQSLKNLGITSNIVIKSTKDFNIEDSQSKESTDNIDSQKDGNADASIPEESTIDSSNQSNVDFSEEIDTLFNDKLWKRYMRSESIEKEEIKSRLLSKYKTEKAVFEILNNIKTEEDIERELNCC